MALNPGALSSSLRAAMLASPAIQAIDGPGLTALCDAIANAVVSHITASAVVTVAPGIPVTTAGTAAAQTGATTAPGSGTIS